jgi:hypothetical protein
MRACVAVGKRGAGADLYGMDAFDSAPLADITGPQGHAHIAKPHNTSFMVSRLIMTPHLESWKRRIPMTIEESVAFGSRVLNVQRVAAEIGHDVIHLVEHDHEQV